MRPSALHPRAATYPWPRSGRGTHARGVRARGRYDRYSHLAMGAAKKALADAGLDKDSIDPFRFGVLIGSGVGGLQAVENSCR